MPAAFKLRTSTLRTDTLRWSGATPSLYEIDIENDSVPPAETFPTMLIQVAFDSDPLDDSPVWTDLTAVCRSVQITRGRSFELDDVQAGQAVFVFNNLDRTLDPTYTAGPFYGQLTVRRRIRCSATFGGITYARFDGFVDSWPQNAPDPSQTFADVTVTATDLFGWLSKNNVRVVAPGITNDPVFGITNSALTGGQLRFRSIETPQARTNRILDLWPLPPSMRAIDTGNTILCRDQVLSPTETSLNYLRRIWNTETGRLFVSKEGAITGQARDHWMSDDSQLNAILTLSDQAQPSYAALVTDPADARYIRNRIARARADMTVPIVAQDLQSILTQGEIPDEKLDLLAQFTADFRAQTQWLLRKYKDPKPRFSSVTLKPQRLPAVMFPAVLGSELGDRINLSHTQTSIGDPMTGDYSIEQVVETIGPLNYQIAWSVAPVDIDTF